MLIGEVIPPTLCELRRAVTSAGLRRPGELLFEELPARGPW